MSNPGAALRGGVEPFVYFSKTKVIFILEGFSSTERTTGSVVQTDDGRIIDGPG